MAKYFLHIIKTPAAVYQERCVIVSEVMQSKMRQAGIIAQSVPDTIYRSEFTSSAYERMVIFIPSSQALQDLNRGRVQRNAPCFARLAMSRGDRPVFMLKIKMFPSRIQGLVETRTG